jgi:hypothetical protein
VQLLKLWGSHVATDGTSNITANQARAEYVAKCNEILEIEMVIVLLDENIANSLNRAEPLVVVNDDALAVYASDAFWQLLDLYREASNRRLDLYAARDYAYAVWKSTAAETTTADTYVSTPQNHR